jgi:two-component SAPR family response regulator
MELEVLLIDDDKIIVMIQERMIKKSSFHAEPLSFLNGKLALDYMLGNNDANTMYFIFLDINMPVMNGWEFLAAVNGSVLANRVMIVVLTSSTNETDKQKTKQYTQVIKYLEKPVTMQNLKELKLDAKLKPYFINNDVLL